MFEEQRWMRGKMSNHMPDLKSCAFSDNSFELKGDCFGMCGGGAGIIGGVEEEKRRR